MPHPLHRPDDATVQTFDLTAAAELNALLDAIEDLNDSIKTLNATIFMLARNGGAA